MDILINKIYKILTNNDKKMVKGIINDSSIESLKLEKISKLITSIILKYRMKPDLHRQDFIVGKGGFGKVWKVYEKSSGKVFAMK